MPVTSTGFPGVRESAAETRSGMIRKDEQTNDNKVFDFIKLFGMSIQVFATKAAYLATDPNQHRLLGCLDL